MSSENQKLKLDIMADRDRLQAENEALRARVTELEAHHQKRIDAITGQLAEDPRKAIGDIVAERDTLRRQLADVVSRRDWLQQVADAREKLMDGYIRGVADLQKQLAARDEALGPFALAFDAAEEAKRRGGSATLTGATNLTFDIEFGGEVLHRVTVHDFRTARAVLKGGG